MSKITRDEVIEMLKKYEKCRRRQLEGVHEDCNQGNCDECDLCYKQGTWEQHLQSIGIAIKTMESLKWHIVADGDLPLEAFGCLVTVMDCEVMTQQEFENILPYFVGYDNVSEKWFDYDGMECPFEIIAWMPLPKPYEGEVEK